MRYGILQISLVKTLNTLYKDSGSDILTSTESLAHSAQVEGLSGAHATLFQFQETTESSEEMATVPTLPACQGKPTPDTSNFREGGEGSPQQGSPSLSSHSVTGRNPTIGDLPESAGSLMADWTG